MADKKAIADAFAEVRADMSGPEFKKLTGLLEEFFKEESEEPEHKNDDVEDVVTENVDGRTDGEMLMDALDSLRGRVEVAASKKA